MPEEIRISQKAAKLGMIAEQIGATEEDFSLLGAYKTLSKAEGRKCKRYEGIPWFDMMGQVGGLCGGYFLGGIGKGIDRVFDNYKKEIQANRERMEAIDAAMGNYKKDLADSNGGAVQKPAGMATADESMTKAYDSRIDCMEDWIKIIYAAHYPGSVHNPRGRGRAKSRKAPTNSDEIAKRMNGLKFWFEQGGFPPLSNFQAYAGVNATYDTDLMKAMRDAMKDVIVDGALRQRYMAS